MIINSNNIEIIYNVHSKINHIDRYTNRNTYATIISNLVCIVRLFRKKESAEVGRDPAVSMLNLANHHNSYSNKSYHINIFRPITS